MPIPVSGAEDSNISPGGGTNQVENQLDQGRLAGPVDAGDGVVLSRINLEVQGLEDLQARYRVTDI